MMIQDPRQRVTGGFSLDEAARLARRSAPGTSPVCPTCGGRMHDVTGRFIFARVWLLRCESCGRGLVFDRPVEGNS